MKKELNEFKGTLKLLQKEEIYIYMELNEITDIIYLLEKLKRLLNK